MRLWTVHPRYLDSKGLVAAWREGLLAQKVLLGQTRGYRHHPQLSRFRCHAHPIAMITAYLGPILDEALARGYRFDATKIVPAATCPSVPETESQLLFEWRHLLAKLAARSPAFHERLRAIVRPDPHPLFTVVPGPVQPWEKWQEPPTEAAPPEPRR